MNYSQQQEAPKTRWVRLVAGVFLAVIIGTIAYGIFWYVTLPTIPDNYKALFVNSVSSSDPRIMETIPPPLALSDKTEEDAQKLFSASRMSTVFDFGNRTPGYLVKILDSDSSEFEAYKSIAGYFLLHSFYDSGGSITFMADAVKSSRFMDSITKKAEAVFPGLFAIPFDKMAYPEKSLYFASYLIAMSDRSDSVAIPANAALELSRAYFQMNKYPDSSLYKTVSTSTLESKLHTQLNIAIDRLEKRKQNNYTEQTGFSHDSVVGLNLTSSTIDSLLRAGANKVFPETDKMATGDNFAVSYAIAKEKVASLYMFTNYLYVRHLALFSDDSRENNAKIEELVKNIIGVSPYEKITEYSWIIKTMKKVSDSDGIYGFYTVKDISSIAERSENFRGYLNTKGYSYILDSPNPL